jgi:hypothetical protein
MTLLTFCILAAPHCQFLVLSGLRSFNGSNYDIDGGPAGRHRSQYCYVNHGIPKP